MDLYSLPAEIITQIATYLCTKDFSNFCILCRHIYESVNAATYWQKKCTQLPELPNKNIYQNLYFLALQAAFWQLTFKWYDQNINRIFYSVILTYSGHIYVRKADCNPKYIYHKKK